MSGRRRDYSSRRTGASSDDDSDDDDRRRRVDRAGGGRSHRREEYASPARERSHRKEEYGRRSDRGATAASVRRGNGSRAGNAGGGRGGGGDDGRGTIAPRILELARLTKTLEKRAKIIGKSQDTPVFREKVETDIEHGREVYTQAAGTLLTAMESARGDAKLERMQRELTDVHTKFEAVCSKVEVTMRVHRVQSVAGAERDVEEGGGRGGSRSANRRLQEQKAMAELGEERAMLEGYGEVEMAILQERDAEARVIARETQELHGLFQEVNVLVAEQSEQLQTVEHQVDEAVTRVQSGNKELEQALEYQRKIRRRMCIIVIIVIVLLACIMIPVGLKYFKKKK